MSEHKDKEEITNEAVEETKTIIKEQTQENPLNKLLSANPTMASIVLMVLLLGGGGASVGALFGDSYVSKVEFIQYQTDAERKNDIAHKELEKVITSRVLENVDAKVDKAVDKARKISKEDRDEAINDLKNYWDLKFDLLIQELRKDKKTR